MNFQEALAASHIVDIGVEARTAKRKDHRGRNWFLVSSHGKHFLVRPDKNGIRSISNDDASRWDDWVPQTEREALKESAFMNSELGLGYRNVILGLVFGPLPEMMEAPDHVPTDFC